MVIKLFENTHNEFSTLAFQLMGIFYITVPITMLAKMSFFNSFFYSYDLPLGFILLLWICDVGAYVVGKNFGKHKLFERISPKKTWEGSVGALITVEVTAYILSVYFDTYSRNDWMIMGFLVLVFSTFGDLFESLLKRNLQIKDSGTMLPGHGGILDRFDGLFMAVPAVFFYLQLTN
jgi:phosphatidate cytidylyltransferase